jgi:hypothetical protein
MTRSADLIYTVDSNYLCGISDSAISHNTRISTTFEKLTCLSLIKSANTQRSNVLMQTAQQKQQVFLLFIAYTCRLQKYVCAALCA